MQFAHITSTIIDSAGHCNILSSYLLPDWTCRGVRRTTKSPLSRRPAIPQLVSIAWRVHNKNWHSSVRIYLALEVIPTVDLDRISFLFLSRADFTSSTPATLCPKGRYVLTSIPDLSKSIDRPNASFSVSDTACNPVFDLLLFLGGFGSQS